MLKRAIIVLSHGSRAIDFTNQFMQVVEIVQKRHSDSLVLPASMQFSEPSLPQAVSEAVAQGADEIIVLACFLFQGNHMKCDIPEMLEELAAQYPGVKLLLSQPIGPDPRIADILSDRMEEVYCRV